MTYLNPESPTWRLDIIRMMDSIIAAISDLYGDVILLEGDEQEFGLDVLDLEGDELGQLILE